MASRPQPIGVTIVAIFLLIGALFSLIGVINLYTSSFSRELTEEASSSLAIVVFLALVNAGLSLACAIGMFNGRNWARWLYIGYVPVLVVISAVNGFRLPMLAGIAEYIIFLIILTRAFLDGILPSFIALAGKLRS